MKAIDDLAGKRFERLTVIRRQEDGKYLCQCDCGNMTAVSRCGLISGHSRSCGCLRIENNRSRGRDLAGKRFGKLTAIRRSTENKGSWLCRCDCGNEVEVTQLKLLAGTATSCGCDRPKLPKNVIDITGQKFGRLTAIRYLGTEGRKAKWLCRCDCGNISEVTSNNLRRGGTKSCGCLKDENHKRRDLTGQRFGRLVAIRPAGPRKWLCRCDCGTETTVFTGALTSGGTRSCGCGRRGPRR